MNLYDGNGYQFLPFAKELRQVAEILETRGGGRTDQYDFGGTGGYNIYNNVL